MSTLTQYTRHAMTDEDRAYEADQAMNDQKDREMKAAERVREAAPDLLLLLSSIIGDEYVSEANYEAGVALIAKAQGDEA